MLYVQVASLASVTAS